MNLRFFIEKNWMHLQKLLQVYQNYDYGALKGLLKNWKINHYILWGHACWHVNVEVPKCCMPFYINIALSQLLFIH